MKKIFVRIFGVVVLVQFFVLQFFVGAQFVVPPHDEYLTDTAGVISHEDEVKIEGYIYEMWQETDVEMAVLVVDSLSGESVRYAGVQVGQERGVGDKETDNGILMLIAIEDREWTIQVGYGLEGIITDAIAKRVGEARFPNHFRAGDYAKGIYQALEDIYKYIQADPEIMAMYEEPEYESISDWQYLRHNRTLWFTLLGIVYFFVGFFISDKYILEKSTSKKKKRKVKKKTGWMNFAIAGAIGTAILGFLTMSFPTAGIESFLILLVTMGIVASPSSGGSGSGYSSSSSSRSYSSGSSYSSSSSSSSFGGFSGGSFGGGGASGSW